jgi:hypothetical protein
MNIGRALVAFACAAAPLSGQVLHPAASASAVTARVRSTSPGGTGDGTAFLGEGSLTLGRISLAVGYLQGKLDPAPAPSAGAFRDQLVEGTVLLGVHATDWLLLEGGPHARAYALTRGGTERWLFWELRARASTAFIGTAVRGYAELWRTVAGDANVPEPLDYAQGGEAGMIMRLARAPLEARVAYRIDNAVLQTRTETVDGVVIGVGLSWR